MSILTTRQIRQLVHNVLVEAGLPPTSCHRMVDHVVDAEICGHPSHGVASVPSLVRTLQSRAFDLDARCSVSLVSDTHLRVEVGRAVPMLRFDEVLLRAAEVAGTHGHCLATFDSSASSGRLATYVEPLARRGFVAFMAAGSILGGDALVSPPGGKRRMLGTNPLALAAPMPDGDPLIIDLASAPITMGRVRLARMTGIRLPVADIRSDLGELCDDPERFYDGGSIATRDLRGWLLTLLVGVLTAVGQAPDIHQPRDQGVSGAIALVLRTPVRWPALLDELMLDVLSEESRFSRLPGRSYTKLRRLAATRGISIEDAVLEAVKAGPRKEPDQ